MRRLRRESDGFTLVELLVVIIILGLLASIVIIGIGSTRSDAVSSTCQQDYSAIALSAEAVFIHEGAYPKHTIDDPADSSTSPLISGAKDAGGNPYDNGAKLKSYPGGDEYRLRYASSNGKSYTLTVLKKNAGGAWVSVGGPDAASRAGCARL